ncbi:MAG: type III pantothenate kinase [Leptospiraceae bacterium]|nr:type III pantothenate kinase [Leptospiraceae bacterium]MCP5510374.1 type III pantothenate kinase [Leptospiraceae bacterium]
MKNTLLVIDIGNTNTVFGVYKKNETEPRFHKRTVTRPDRTSDELGVFLKGFFHEEGMDPGEIDSAIYSSVVPGFNPIVSRMLGDWFKVEPVIVNYRMKLPFTIQYPRPFEIGADRLVNAAAVVHMKIGKSIIVDMGTATTFCVVNEEDEYLGGVIAPGLKLSMDALTRNTAQLPPITFQKPGSILGGSTLESLQSGFFYGWVGLLRGIIQEIKNEFGEDYKVVGTGGLVSTIDSSYSGIFDHIDPLMTLRGLEFLYQLNRSQ